MSTESTCSLNPTRAHRWVSWSVLTGLLFLRLPFLAGLSFFLRPEKDWLDPIFQIGTYLLTAFLIWWERDRLSDFHIDALAIAIIVLFKPIQTLILASWHFKSALTFPSWPSLALWVIAAGLFAVFWLDRSRRPRIQLSSLRWFVVGTVGGCVLAILFGYPISLQINKYECVAYTSNLFALLDPVPVRFLYLLGYAAVTEEPLFRGFLWGYLRKLGWKEVWIWLLQAGLFALGHIYWVDKAPISFWILAPVSGLVMGLFAWRSRSIVTSLAAHGAWGALGYTVGCIVLWRL